jgi:site-specific DNA-cytosine methylase
MASTGYGCPSKTHDGAARTRQPRGAGTATRHEEPPVPVSKTRKKKAGPRTAVHRPAARKRLWRWDELIAVDLFSGFGGLTAGIRRAGFTTILAANHNEYKTRVHEENHPDAEHWIADLVDPTSSDYHSAADLPAADILVAGISCTNHSGANTQKAYEQGLTLFDIADDEEYTERVTRSEKDRATALCILQYAEKHHPKMILVECTTEFTSWGPALPGRKKVGDGSTYRWWRTQVRNMKYKARVLYLNSQFFGVSQSRDRIYIVFWDESLPAPDLDHRPATHCPSCDEVVGAVWTWKTGVPPSGTVRYGQQYKYCCPRCKREIVPPMTPSVNSIDFSNLGTKIGEKPSKTFKDGFVGPMARETMGRAQRCFERFPEFPPVLLDKNRLPQTHPWQNGAQQVTSTGAAMVAAGNTYERAGSDCRSRDLAQPLWTQSATNGVGLATPPVAVAGHVIAAHRHNGDGQYISGPMDTVTSTHEKAIVIAGIDNYQGVARGVGEPAPTQGGSETMALVSAGIMPNRTNATNSGMHEPSATVVAGAGSGGLGVVSAGVMPFRQHTVPTTHAEPMPTVTADQNPGLLSTQGQLLAGWYKQNGSTAGATSPHPVSDPFGAHTANDTTGLLAAWWKETLAELTLADCYFRMLFPWEVGKSCDFDCDFPGYKGTFKVWGTAKQQIDGYGNAVSPAVGTWIGNRLRPVLLGARDVLI